MTLIEIQNEMMERRGFEKKPMNPPIGAIKDRLIGGFGGFGGKSKISTSITDPGIKTS
ncbi:hypothetical protein NAG83_19155 [Pseudomonas carnis]|uniref:hypothetical protein n=1 Tax=Pseudomonas carnis TaxID=2487355 RepID=UPI002095F389|nr:hypothetical protein [Pseudomonas carnis]MCO7038622.1 hypothetical protein [Pseudomonas carnis]